MASKASVAKQVNWLSFIPSVILILLLIYGFYLIHPDFGPYVAVVAYIAIAFGLRTLVPKYHRKGMQKIKAKKFEEAIADFENSYAFFQKHPWIDTFRAITIMSGSRMCYLEMALINIAFCYGQMGQPNKTIEYYERTLKAYPKNEIAISGLTYLKSAMEKKPRKKAKK